MNQKLTTALATSITAVTPTALAGWGKGGASSREGFGDITLRTRNAGVPEELSAVQNIVDSYSAGQDNT